jgi:hypothetical protein
MRKADFCMTLDLLLEDQDMIASRKPGVTLYVDRFSQQWVVLDHEGNFWTLPVTDNPWEQRQPFTPTGETDLKSVPGHYKNALGLPF